MEALKIDLAKLSNAEYIAYMRNYLQEIDRYPPVRLSVEEAFLALEATVGDIEEVYRIDRASEFTKEIDRLDQLRGQYLSCLFQLIRGYRKHSDPGKAAAARRVHRHLSVYGTASSINRETLQGQTTSINNLTHDLQNTPKLQTAIATLALDDLVEALRTTNLELRTANDNRISEKGRAPKNKIKDLRVEGNARLYRLRNQLWAHALIEGEGSPHHAVVHKHNVITDQYNLLLARRRGGITGTPEEEGN